MKRPLNSLHSNVLKPLSRRALLRYAGTAALASALPRVVQARAGSQAGSLRVCVHLRGGADGLSLVVPYADPRYGSQRARTKITAALPLDARFGLHPQLQALQPLWLAGELAVWPAVGASEVKSSHARAQRALRAAFDAAVPEGAVLELSERDRPFPGWSLAERLQLLAERVHAGTAPCSAWLDMSGWDTHVAQGNGARGRMAEQTLQLANALADFRQRLGDRFADVTVVVVSELGRTLSENLTSGTDDDHVTAALVLGGALERRGVIEPDAASGLVLGPTGWSEHAELETLFGASFVNSRAGEPSS